MLVSKHSKKSTAASIICTFPCVLISQSKVILSVNLANLYFQGHCHWSKALSHPSIPRPSQLSLPPLKDLLQNIGHNYIVEYSSMGEGARINEAAPVAVCYIHQLSSWRHFFPSMTQNKAPYTRRKSLGSLASCLGCIENKIWE